MTPEELTEEIKSLKDQLDKVEATSTVIVKELQNSKRESKDKWDIIQILFLPIIVAAIGFFASITITQTQLKVSKQIAQRELTKDYVSILTEAASKQDEYQLLLVLDSLAALKEKEGQIPPAIVGIVGRIKRDWGQRSRKILQASSNLISSEDEEKLESYFGSED